MKRLVRLTLSLSFLITTAAVCHAQTSNDPVAVPFSISSFSTRFAMQGEFEGEYRILPDSVEILVKKAVVRISTNCPYKGRRRLGTITFGLAMAAGEKSWKRSTMSQPFIVERVMSAGDEIELGAMYFSIPRYADLDLQKHWLLVQMSDFTLDLPDEKPREGAAFAHSCRDIFYGKK
jgi:hypothetical protein